MSAKSFTLTEKVRSRILSAIHSGGYPHVAAQAVGVPLIVFDEWLQLGRQPRARPPYLTFAREVEEACATARLTAEIAVFKEDPKTWLEHGPAREAPGNPGWSVSVKPADHLFEARNALLDPQVLRLLRSFVELLTPFPEARALAAKKLLEMEASVEHLQPVEPAQPAAENVANPQCAVNSGEP